MKSRRKLAGNGNHRGLITFTVGSKEYGIDIQKIHEVRGYDMFNSIVNTPEFINGAINMCGASVPLLDVRVKFHIDREAFNEPVVIIVLNIAKRLIGIVVDGVSDVITLAAEQITPAPNSGSSPHMRYVSGLGSVDGRMIHVVDIEKLVTGNNMAPFALKGSHGTDME